MKNKNYEKLNSSNSILKNDISQNSSTPRDQLPFDITQENSNETGWGALPLRNVSEKLDSTNTSPDIRNNVRSTEEIIETQDFKRGSTAKKSSNIINQKSPSIVKFSKQPSSSQENIKKALSILSPSKMTKSVMNGIKKLGEIGFERITRDLKKVGGALGSLGDKMNINKLFRRRKRNDQLSRAEKEVLILKGHMKRSDSLAAGIVITNTALSFYENEDFFNPLYEVNHLGETIVVKKRNESTPWGNSIRALVILLTLALIILIYLHYHFSLKILKKKRLRLSEDTIRSSGLAWKMILEMIFCSICTPPYFDYTFSGYMLNRHYEYSYNSLFSVLHLFKGYLILRLYGHYSAWRNEKAIRTCKKYGTKASVGFAIKSELRKRPYIMLGILMLVTILYLGLAMRTFEISYEGNDGNSFDFNFVANSMWLIIITMTTVGFGEGYPSTHLGRFIGVIACIIGMLLVSLMVVSLTVASEFTEEESKAYFVLKKIQANDTAKTSAANVVKSLFRLNKEIKAKREYISFSTRYGLIKNMRKCITIFKNNFRVANSHNLPVDEILKSLQDKIENNLNDIKKDLKSIPELEKRCISLKDRQTRMIDSMDEMIKLQGMVGEYMIRLNSFSDGGTPSKKES